MKLSHRTVGSLKTGEYRDSKVRGLVLRVKPTGNRSWALRYVRELDGRRQRHTIGTFPEYSLDQARTAASELLAAIARGADPRGEHVTRASSLTFRQLAELMLERNDKLAPNTRALYQHFFDKDVFPVIGNFPAASVTSDHVRQIQSATAKRGSVVKADRLRSGIGSVYRWAASHNPVPGIVSNPARGIGALGTFNARRRPWSDAELRAVWLALEPAPIPDRPKNSTGQPDLRRQRGADQATRDIVRLCALTACRRAEAAGAQVSEFRLDALGGPLWIIPGRTAIKGKSVRGRTKSQREKIVPLPSQAVEIVRSAMARAATEAREGSPAQIADELARCLFSAASGVSKTHHVSPHAATRAVARITSRLGIENATLHDLRATCRTWLKEQDVSSDVRDHILGHVGQSVGERHYEVPTMKFVNGRVRLALQAWADHVETVTSAQMVDNFANVTALRA